MSALSRFPLAAALLLPGCAGPADGPDRANVVLISIDTLRADHLGTYGRPEPTTPSIDRLARESVTFASFVSHSPSTLAAHASFLTSLLPQHHSGSVASRTIVSPEVPTLAEVLRDAGYATASFNGGAQLDASFGLDRGFGVYESSRSFGDGPDALVGPETRLSHAVARGLAWLGGVHGPFFLFLHSYEIHHPYTPDATWLGRFDRGYDGPLADDISVALLRRINRGAEAIAPRDVRHIVAAYDAELRSADRAVGELVRELRARGWYDDTLIVVVSDHGEEFGEHGAIGWHAHTLFDELLLVPAVVKFPRAAHARRIVREQVRGVDLAPTILGVLGLRPPPEFGGRDVRPLLSDGPSQAPAAIARRDKPNPGSIGIRTERWKLYNDRLFDLERDPLESVDVAARLPAVLDSLAALHAEIVASREAAPTAPTDTPPEVVRQLRSLGYVD